MTGRAFAWAYIFSTMPTMRGWSRRDVRTSMWFDKSPVFERRWSWHRASGRSTVRGEGSSYRGRA